MIFIPALIREGGSWMEGLDLLSGFNSRVIKAVFMVEGKVLVLNISSIILKKSGETVDQKCL